MRTLPILALLALIAGFATLAYAAASGQGQVHLVLIFPVFTGTGLAAFLGMILVMAGFFLGFLSFARFPAIPEPPPTDSVAATASPATAQSSKRFGGIVFLGPVPIVFGSDARVAKWMLVLGIAMTILLLAFFVLVLARA